MVLFTESLRTDKTTLRVPERGLAVVALFTSNVGAALRVYPDDVIDRVPRQRRHHRAMSGHVGDAGEEGDRQ